MTKSGLADSPFFSPPPAQATEAAAPSLYTDSVPQEKETSSPPAKERAIKTPRQHDTVVSSNRDTTPPRNQDTMIEVVRKALKAFGKEAATHRFTLEEKKAVLDVIYSYKGIGIKTSENEVARIAINYILEDYRLHGENSILDQVLRALNE